MKKAIFFEITDLCNHKCIHCCKGWRTDHGHIMNKKMLDKIISLPKSHLTISGGEPSLVLESVRYILDREQCGITINTNLTNWTHQDILQISQKVTFAVSVVSMIRKEYELITKANTFDRFQDNLMALPRSSRIIIIVNDVNYWGLETSVAKLITMGFKHLIISPAVEVGNKILLRDVVPLKIREIYKKNRHVYIETMNRVDGLPYNHTCDAGKGRIVILSNGDAVPCACFDGHILGNIMVDDFDEISRRGDEFYLSYPPNQRDICKGVIENCTDGTYTH